jgi:hypothetical protein
VAITSASSIRPRGLQGITEIHLRRYESTDARWKYGTAASVSFLAKQDAAMLLQAAMIGLESQRWR